MDNRELFTDKSGDYARYRPSYPAAALGWLRERCVGECVADIGAGTGIFTACLLPYFQTVCAVEPNADMRKVFTQTLPDILCTDGCGEATGLPAQSVDLITVAQAFHWLDEEQFKLEALRILRPGGMVAIVWNNSLECDFTAARNEVCKKYCPRFRSGHAGKRTPAEGDLFLRYSYFKQVEYAEFDNPFVMDFEAFAGNMRSRSYVLKPGDGQYEEFWSELHSVFEKYSHQGRVTDLQQTTIYLGRF